MDIPFFIILSTQNIIKMENLKKMVPYNLFIGTPTNPCDHLVEVIEVWEDIIGYEGVYKISSFGRVKSVRRRTSTNILIEEKLLTIRKSEKGYLTVGLNFPVETTKFVHVLVAECFIKNPSHKPIVNHKNGIKTDAFYLNLEWVTYSENTIHSYQTGLQSAKQHESQCKPIFDAYMGIFYDSAGDAAKAFNVFKSTILRKASRKNNNRFIFVK